MGVASPVLLSDTRYNRQTVSTALASLTTHLGVLSAVVVVRLAVVAGDVVDSTVQPCQPLPVPGGGGAGNWGRPVRVSTSAVLVLRKLGGISPCKYTLPELPGNSYYFYHSAV